MYVHHYPFTEEHKKERNNMRAKLAANFLPMLKIESSNCILEEISKMVKQHLYGSDMPFLQFLEELKLLRIKRL